MKALILAAGYATRLYPLTRDQPKPLLPIGGRAIIDLLVDELETLPALDQIYVVTNHRFAELFSDWAASRLISKPMEILDDGTVAPEGRLGAIGDIAWAIHFRQISDILLVMAADNIFPFKFSDFAAFAAEKGTDCITCYHLTDENRLRRTGIIARGEDGLVTRFEEKPARPWSNLAVPPIYCYIPETLPLFEEYLAAGQNPDAPGHFIPWLVERRPVHAYLFSGEATDIGDLRAYREACVRRGHYA